MNKTASRPPKQPDLTFTLWGQVTAPTELKQRQRYAVNGESICSASNPSASQSKSYLPSGYTRFRVDKMQSGGRQADSRVLLAAAIETLEFLAAAILTRVFLR
ncbi:hypothetical protein PoB_002667700 [Plakobranchus ocellatus]|uniref:Uncharacterized protein n=1 Tax=Plakobranchus ocellatus TaxID=259542 RepID=A0AAV3ZYN4_9GAST|nr:hypothetical protein PoB_002667700 [Plakobranchus ocellatus]